jgi:uncharacterized protein (TIRG00374 family)
MIAIIVGDLCIRAVRWRILLSYAAPAAGLGQLFELETMGLAVNNLTFFRLGEVVRAGLAAKELGVSALTALSTIFVERMTDTMALIFLFGTAVHFYPALIPLAFGWTAYAILGGLIATLVILAVIDEYLHEQASGGILGKYPVLLNVLRRAALGTRALCSWGAVLKVGILSLALWAWDAGLYWAGTRAMGFNPGLSYGHSILILSSAAATSFLPAVPGSFGTFEQTVKIAMEHLGFDGTAALGYAGFLHIVNYLIVTGLGIVFFYRAGYTLGSLKALRPS